ncbi:hypothetical protein VTN02DRAFT_6291 [Thermoascus thermophilus]
MWPALDLSSEGAAEGSHPFRQHVGLLVADGHIAQLRGTLRSPSPVRSALLVRDRAPDSAIGPCDGRWRWRSSGARSPTGLNAARAGALCTQPASDAALVPGAVDDSVEAFGSRSAETMRCREALKGTARLGLSLQQAPTPTDTAPSPASASRSSNSTPPSVIGPRRLDPGPPSKGPSDRTWRRGYWITDFMCPGTAGAADS